MRGGAQRAWLEKVGVRFLGGGEVGLVSNICSNSCNQSLYHPCVGLYFSNMGDYYRADRYSHAEDDRRYPREDSHRYDYSGERARDDHHPPQGRSRSRERPIDRDRDDYYRDDYYGDRGRDRERERWPNDRDRYRDSRDNDGPQSSARQERAEPYHDDHFMPSREPRQERHRGQYEEPYDAGKPNSQVIFRGLDKDITEQDVYEFYSNFLEAMTDFHSCKIFFSINKAPLLKM